MKRQKSKWLRVDAVLGKPNQSAKCSMQVLSVSELGRWIAAHLNQGYTVTLSEAKHETTVPRLQTASQRASV